MANILFAFSKTLLLFNPVFYSNVITCRHHHLSQKEHKATYIKISLKTQQLSKICNTTGLGRVAGKMPRGKGYGGVD